MSGLNERTESQLSRRPGSINNSILNLIENVDTKPEVEEKQSGKFAVFIMKPKKLPKAPKLRKIIRKNTNRAGGSSLKI